QATDFAGPSVLIPVAGRVPGAFGSQWQTDLVVTNASRTGNPVPVTIVFSRADGGEQFSTTELPPRASLISRDVVRELFGQTSGLGMIRITSPWPQARLTARARIYNVGSSVGEFGQTVHAMPLASLSREAYLAGLSGTGGNRTNVGIANPGPNDVALFLSLFEADGNFRGGFSTVIPSGTVRQYNDIFAEFGAGNLDGATLQVTSSDGVYPYASIVRSDSGDADFVTATGVAVDEAEVIVNPQCAAPAPLRLAPIPAEGWIVMYANNVDAAATTAALATKYGFTPKTVYENAFKGFVAELTHAVIAELRCEPVVTSVEQNARVPLSGQ
ncbi:MAG TPA: protease inhibitor I9 family protein, partial [Gemmatimonadaceae bacterium]|nr:protease inhibitor I9 family protein [Gemmatimonadaceae bacterium]